MFDGWNDTVGGHHAEVFSDHTLWDVISRMYLAARMVYQNHATWTAQGYNISDMQSAHFYLTSGPEFFGVYRKVRGPPVRAYVLPPERGPPVRAPP